VRRFLLQGRCHRVRAPGDRMLPSLQSGGELREDKHSERERQVRV
jgi:hypothetical protein